MNVKTMRILVKSIKTCKILNVDLNLFSLFRFQLCDSLLIFFSMRVGTSTMSFSSVGGLWSGASGIIYVWGGRSGMCIIAST